MRLQTILLAVKDLERSRAFYQTLFQQEVVLDLGRNLTFSGGFSIQQDFDWLIGVPPNSIHERSHTMELYFEVDDFEAFLDQLEKYPDIEYVNRPMTHDWKQRVVRIYDPDYHIIEIGESMSSIAKRYLQEGHSIEETAQIIQHPVEFVKRVSGE